jgi:hypothetical protein
MPFQPRRIDYKTQIRNNPVAKLNLRVGEYQPGGDTPPSPPSVGRFSKTWNGSDSTWDLTSEGVTAITQVLFLRRSLSPITEGALLDFTVSGAVIQMLDRDSHANLVPINGEESDAIILY